MDAGERAGCVETGEREEETNKEQENQPKWERETEEPWKGGQRRDKEKLKGVTANLREEKGQLNHANLRVNSYPFYLGKRIRQFQPRLYVESIFINYIAM